MIVELKEGGFYRLEFLKFSHPVRNDYSFSFADIKYELVSGAEGALLLVPMTTELSLGGAG